MNQATRYVRVDRDDPDPLAIDAAAEVLKSGGLVAFPTETVYGLGADATDSLAVSKIFEAKGRPSTNPLIVHGHDAAALRLAVLEWPSHAERLAQRFWPGPLTLILPRSAVIPDAVTGGSGTVGVRVPDSVVARRLLARAGRLVAAPSANRSTRVSPTRGEHVLNDLDGRIAMILDSGPTPIGIESTVLDLTTDPIRILRPGAITRDQIQDLLGIDIEYHVQTLPQTGVIAASPGQAEVHYAPTTPVEIIDPSRGFAETGSNVRASGLIVVGQTLPADFGVHLRRIDWLEPADAERSLYETLHDWDDGRLDVIHVVLPPEHDAWLAVRDRLWRASRRWARPVSSR